MGMIGCWEARNYSFEGVMTLDTGSLAIPLPLPLNAGATIHLQRSVEGWSAQAMAKHALCNAPPIRLMRFKQQGEAVNKDVRSLKGLTGVVHFPVYTAAATLHTVLMPYQVAAVQHHSGDRPVTGHYRRMLHGQNQLAAGRSWVTNDSCSAQPTAPDAYSATAYL